MRYKTTPKLAWLSDGHVVDAGFELERAVHPAVPPGRADTVIPRTQNSRPGAAVARCPLSRYTLLWYFAIALAEAAGRERRSSVGYYRR